MVLFKCTVNKEQEQTTQNISEHNSVTNYTADRVYIFDLLIVVVSNE